MLTQAHLFVQITLVVATTAWLPLRIPRRTVAYAAYSAGVLGCWLLYMFSAMALDYALSLDVPGLGYIALGTIAWICGSAVFGVRCIGGGATQGSPDGHGRATGRAKLISIGAIVLIVTGGICFGRYRGLPMFMSRIPTLGPFLTAYVGIRITTRGNSGYLEADEVYRGKGILYETPWFMTSHGEPPDHLKVRIVHGRYYSPQGDLVSRIENGNGTAVLFHTNGLPALIQFFSDGARDGPLAAWTSEGDPLVMRGVTGGVYRLDR